MAKKVVIENDEENENKKKPKKKKKHSKCLTCCLIFLIVTLVIFGAAFGVGWYFGDKFTTEYLGLSLGDTLGVLGDLYWTDDEDVVRRPYGAADVNGFYSEIKRNVFLKDSADIDFDAALSAAVENFLKEGESEPKDGKRVRALNSDGSSEGDEDSGITGILVDMIVGVLNRDNIDVERINAYDENDPSTDEFIFRLNDRELAAFVNVVLGHVLSAANGLADFGGGFFDIQLNKVIALKQIIFKGTRSATEDGESEITASSAAVTLWIGLQDAANQALHKAMDNIGFGWAGGIAGWIGDVLLPENVYITLDIPIYGDAKAAIIINDMDASEQARANKLINGIMSLTGSGKTFDDLLDDFIGEVKPFLESAAEKMDFSDVDNGTISVDLLQTLAEMASEGAEGEALNKADFIYLLQALFSDMDAQLTKLTPYRYDNWYNENGVAVYRETGGNPANKIDYENEFIKELRDKYALNVGESSGLDDVLAMLGISLDGDNNANPDDMLNHVDSARFKQLLNASNMDDIKLIITDRMLGATLSKQTGKLMQGQEGMENLHVAIDALTFVNKADKPDHLYALIAAEINLTDMLDELNDGAESLISKLASGFIPDKVLLTVTVDITRNRSINRERAELIINSCDNTDRAIAALEKLVGELDFTTVASQIGDTLNEMLDELDSKLSTPIALRPSSYTPDGNGWAGEAGAITMPDIFTIVTDLALVTEQPDGTRERVVTPEQLKNVIRDLNAPGVVSSNISENGIEAFIDDVMDKYYFKRDENNPIKDFDALTAYMADFDSNKFRIDGADGLAHDTREVGDLKPIMRDPELGALIDEKLMGNALVDEFDIVCVQSGEDSLAVVLSVDISDLMDGAAQVTKLIDAKKLYVTALFNLSDDELLGDGTEENPYGYEVQLKINVEEPDGDGYMSEDTFGAMMNIVRFFSPSFDIQSQMDEVGVILYEQMQELNNSLATVASSGENEESQDSEEPAENVKYFYFTEGGLEIIDFYTFLAHKMHPELLSTSSADAIKNAVQGMYAVAEDAPNPNNYAVEDIIFNRPTGAEWHAENLIGTHLDSDFNSFLKDGVEQIAPNGEVSVDQTIILSSGDDSDTARQIRKWINGNLKEKGEDADYITDDQNYMVITFSMSMENYIGQDENDDDMMSEGLFPTVIYATVVFKYDEEASEFVRVPDAEEDNDVPALIFNNMNYEQYHVMVTLMGVSPDTTNEEKVNIVSVTNKCAKVLNGIFDYGLGVNVAFGRASVPGAVGTITISSSLLEDLA